MSDGNVTVALFGDCATQMAAETYTHTRAVGLTNWLSIVSPTTENFQRLTEEVLENTSLSNYWKRICLLNSNKRFLEYLLEEKADYLIIDCNDCRKQLIFDDSVPYKARACITDNWFMPGFNDFVNIMFEHQEGAKYVPSTAIDKKQYERAVVLICDEIKKVYDTSRIVLNKHYYADSYVDEKGIHRYIRDHSDDNDETIELIKYIEALLEKYLKGCHIIDFPDNVMGDKNHKLGIYSLHYHPLYYEYVREAMEIIFQGYNEEKIILRQLQFNYSMRFQMSRMEMLNEYRNTVLENEVDNIIGLGRWTGTHPETEDIYDILRCQNNIKGYLDVLYMLRDKIIVLLATRDTSGFYKDSIIFRKLKRLGVKDFPAKLWWMYAAVIFRGSLLVSKASSRVDEPVMVEQVIGNKSVLIKSESFRNGNQAVINIDGNSYALNKRGVNIVVCRASDGGVVDSVSYDSHIMEGFYREFKST